MGVLLPQATHRLLLLSFVKAAALQHRCQQSHVGNIQYIPAPQSFKTLHSQQHRLGNVIWGQVSHAFQSRLHDLPVIPVDIFTVIDLLHHAFFFRSVLHNREGHIGLQSHKRSAFAGEGNNFIGHQKILVAYIEVVFFKLAHFKGDVTIAPVQRPQGEYRLFLISPDLIRYH